MESVLGKLAKDAATDAAMKKTYDEAAAAQKPETEVHARHILVATEDDAQAALKRLKAGEDFAKVAKEVSKDPGSEGGDLGWFTKERMVPEFADAAFKLEPGQLSEPVKSQFGWHIIKVEGKRQKTFPPFDQVKDQVAHYVVQKAQSDLIVKLRKDAKIERLTPEADNHRCAGDTGCAGPRRNQEIKPGELRLLFAGQTQCARDKDPPALARRVFLRARPPSSGMSAQIGLPERGKTGAGVDVT